jgi:hypothetical protein
MEPVGFGNTSLLGSWPITAQNSAQTPGETGAWDLLCSHNIKALTKLVLTWHSYQVCGEYIGD